MHLATPVRRFISVRWLALMAGLPFTMLGRATGAPPAEAAPPVYADAEHVHHGCHLSTLAYLVRFCANFPAEQSEHAVLEMGNPGGGRRSHTIALVTWRNEWWGRDEYLGVFRLGIAATPHPDDRKLRARAASVLDRLNRRESAPPHYRRPPMSVGALSAGELAREAAVAARILPYPSQTYWVRAAGRAEENTVAVYDPHRGTCVAECVAQNDTAIVRAIAGRLGYDAASVRPDSNAAPVLIALAR